MVAAPPVDQVRDRTEPGRAARVHDDLVAIVEQALRSGPPEAVGGTGDQDASHSDTDPGADRPAGRHLDELARGPFPASDDSGFMTGSVLTASGGHLVR
jgi:hypothetical protein